MSTEDVEWGITYTAVVGVEESLLLATMQYCSDKRFTREVRTRGQGAGGTRGNSRRIYKLRSFPLSPCPLVPLSIQERRNPLTKTYWATMHRVISHIQVEHNPSRGLMV